MTIISLAVAILLALLVALRLYAHLSSGERTSGVDRAITVATSAVAVVVLLDPPALAAAADRLLHAPDVSTLLEQLAALVALAAWTIPAIGIRPIAGRWFWGTLLAAAAMIVLFAAAPVHRHRLESARFPDFTTAAAHSGWVQAYWAVFAVAAGARVVAILRSAWLYLRVVSDRPTRVALISLLAAGGFASCYFVLNTVAMVQSSLHHDVAAPMAAGIHLATAGAGVAAMLGVSVPNALVAELAGQVRCWLTFLALHRVWSRLTRASPEILVGRVGAATGIGWDAETRLYRRVIEIHDGFQALGPWYDADADLRAGTEDLQAVELARWELAARAKRAGVAAVNRGAPPVRSGTTVIGDALALRRYTRGWRSSHRIADAAPPSTIAS